MVADIRRLHTFCATRDNPALPTGSPAAEPPQASPALDDIALTDASPRYRHDALRSFFSATRLRPPTPRLRGPARDTGFMASAWLVAQCLRAPGIGTPEVLEQFAALRAVAALAEGARRALRRGDAKLVQTCLSRIENELVCPLHQGLLHDAAALACGHLFEASWLAPMFEKWADGTPPCPTCRADGARVPPPEAVPHILRALRNYQGQMGRPIELPVVPPDIRSDDASDDDEAVARQLEQQEFEDMARLFTPGHRIEVDFDPDADLRMAGNLPPLVQAVFSGDPDFVRSVIAMEEAEETLELNRILAGERTVLHIATDRGHVEVVRALLDAGAEPDVVNEADYTPLHSAAARGHVEIIALLLERGADINACDPSPLFEAVSTGQLESIRTLLAAGAAMTSSDSSVLHEAVDSREMAVIRLLLERGCDVRQRAGGAGGATALDCAVEFELPDVVEILLEAYAALDPDAREDWHTPLCHAVQSDNSDIVAKFIAAGAELNVLAHTYDAGPLHVAVRHLASASLIAQLLAAGAKPDFPDANGETALTIAENSGQADILGLLSNAMRAPAGAL